MNTFIRFFYEFISIFFEGLIKMFKGITDGFIQIVNFSSYMGIINSYKDNFSGGEWVMVVLAIVALVIMLGFVLLLIFFAIRKLVRFNRNLNQDDLLEEIANLNDQVVKLMKEKDDIMAIKVSQLGIKPGEEAITETAANETPAEIEKIDPNIRFPKLAKIDEEYKSYKVKNYSNNFTLEEVVDNLLFYLLFLHF